MISFDAAQDFLDVRPSECIVVDHVSPFVVVFLRAYDECAEVDRSAAAQSSSAAVIDVLSILLRCFVMPIEFGVWLEGELESFGHVSLSCCDVGVACF